jgi:stage IV sporulation protein FB
MTLVSFGSAGTRADTSQMFDQPRATMPPPPPPPPPPAPPQEAPALPERTGASFKLFGIPVHLNVSFLLVAGVFLYAPGRSVSSMLVVIAMLLVSILWHEIGHAVAMKAYGYEPEISLMAFMGLTYSSAERRPSDREELLIASAGPAAGLLLAGLAQMLRETMFADAYSHPLDALVIINVAVSVFNLLPAYPLDGGRIAKSLLQMVSPRGGETAAQVVSLVAAGLAIVYSVNHGMEITALILLGVAAVNFGGLKSKLTGPVTP